MKKFVAASLALCMSLTPFTVYAGKNDAKNSKTESTEAETEAESIEAKTEFDENGTHTVVDHAGNTVEVPNHITRVVIDQIPILSTYGCFGYPKQKEVLHDINISLEAGHILSILGPNGIGKTTLLKCMIGLLSWSSGHSLLNGQYIQQLKAKEIWNTISYIPQTHGFSFSYTGLEMVMMGRSSHLGLFEQPGTKEIEMAKAMMEKTGITHLAAKDCNRMSGGELQMVLIARALINEPKLIILDEPETGLDFHNQILVLNMVEKLAHEDGISAIMNTHSPTNAMRIADEAFMMNKNGDRFYGKAADILNEENISKSFDVNVIVDEVMYNDRKLRSIIPVSLTE